MTLERVTHREPARNFRPDGGSATVFVIGFAVVLLVLAGLVVDGGLAINARQQVADDVEQAARAGAERVDLPTLRGTGVVRLDQDAARSASLDFLTTRGYPAGDVDVSVDPDDVTASATRQLPTALLSLIFIRHFTVTATGHARPAVGITGELTP